MPRRRRVRAHRHRQARRELPTPTLPPRLRRKWAWLNATTLLPLTKAASRAKSRNLPEGRCVPRSTRGARNGNEWLTIHKREQVLSKPVRDRSTRLVRSSNHTTARFSRGVCRGGTPWPPVPPPTKIGIDPIRPIFAAQQIKCETLKARSRVPTSTRDSSTRAHRENPSRVCRKHGPAGFPERQMSFAQMESLDP